MKNKKGMILDYLKRIKRATTWRICVGIKASMPRGKYLLEELEKEGKVIKEQETRDCYWIINKNMEEGIS